MNLHLKDETDHLNKQKQRLLSAMISPLKKTTSIIPFYTPSGSFSVSSSKESYDENLHILKDKKNELKLFHTLKDKKNELKLFFNKIKINRKSMVSVNSFFVENFFTGNENEKILNPSEAMNYFVDTSIKIRKNKYLNDGFSERLQLVNNLYVFIFEAYIQENESEIEISYPDKLFPITDDTKFLCNGNNICIMTPINEKMLIEIYKKQIFEEINVYS